MRFRPSSLYSGRLCETQDMFATLSDYGNRAKTYQCYPDHVVVSEVPTKLYSSKLLPMGRNNDIVGFPIGLAFQVVIGRGSQSVKSPGSSNPGALLPNSSTFSGPASRGLHHAKHCPRLERSTSQRSCRTLPAKRCVSANQRSTSFSKRWK